MWKTIARVPWDIVEKVKVIAENISQRDETFTYKMEKNYLTVFSSDKNQAHRRAMWFIHNVDSRLAYEAEEC